MADNAQIAALLKRLEPPQLNTIDLSLGRMERFLAAIGHPERRLPLVIHVAGTNGKGSLVAYLQAIFHEAGYRVHRYISPHLVRFNERIVLGHEPIEDGALLELLRRVEAVAREYPVTFFEATTAAAFLAFAQNPADVLLLEVGMGGRLDATNVVTPVLTAITPVSLDHCEYLGNTLTAVAMEKAGIVKPEVPCVLGPQEAEAQREIERIAALRQAPLYRYGREWNIERMARGFAYRSPVRRMDAVPSLPGEHQHRNAAAAIACIEQLPQFKINDAQIAGGIAAAVWPGRLQRLTRGPLVESLPENSELWLDGGHNPSAGQALADWLKTVNNSCPLYVISGMVKTKDSAGYYAPLAPYVSRLFAVAIPQEETSQSAEDIRAAAQCVGMACEAVESPAAAMRRIAGIGGPCRVLICGSLYLAGKILRDHQ